MKVDAILQNKPSRIIAIVMTETVERALRLLKTENIGALVVKDTCGTEGDAILGMLTERDIARALADHGAAVLRMPVSALVRPGIVACNLGDDVDAVISLMQQHHVRHIPVLDRDSLAGVVSIRDVLGSPAPHGAGALHPQSACAAERNRKPA